MQVASTYPDLATGCHEDLFLWLGDLFEPEEPPDACGLGSAKTSSSRSSHADFGFSAPPSRLLPLLKDVPSLRLLHSLTSTLFLSTALSTIALMPAFLLERFRRRPSCSPQLIGLAAAIDAEAFLEKAQPPPSLSCPVEE
ncbi:hypothetical protein HRG_007011 [Hirsutella rhossiliensis]|uniref:Uncharacterized protein n=1 Tax=Hirsutella rhossiliensis TaxID=111463 RepID=A0A9P8MX83_9HYPO|nr:uncharacterized protein HRG_07011 [Hirsutella rhossiliensis]KAH0961931.1 hypothetical protein HRG_07011 [Hirsutella rhossiliensis]